MAYNAVERPGTLNLRGRGEYVNAKVRTSERQISDQAEPRDYDPLRSDTWDLHRSSYNRISDLTHNQFHSTTQESLDRTVRERARLPPDRSHPLHVVRSFGVTDTALSRQLSQLKTGVLPAHPTGHNQHSMQSTYRESYGRDGPTGTQKEPRCQPSQTADKWMQFRRRKSWLFDTDQAPTQFTDDALTCPPVPREVRACTEAAQNARDTCRIVDELEQQVATLQHKLDEAHRPEPVPEPPLQGEAHNPADSACPDGSVDQPGPAASPDDRGPSRASDQEDRTPTPGPDPDPTRPDPADPADPEYPSARRLTGPCAPPEQDLSEVSPAVDTSQCPDPPPPTPPPPCPRGPVPCAAVPPVPGCRPEPPPAARYRSTYTAGYSDPEAGLRQTAAPRASGDLYRGPAPLPRLARCPRGLTPAVATDTEPTAGPATAAACRHTV